MQLGVVQALGTRSPLEVSWVEAACESVLRFFAPGQCIMEPEACGEKAIDKKAENEAGFHLGDFHQLGLEISN